MPVALYKRHAMSPECLLDQPVPLAYYNTANGEFHPRTIRQLINLKAKKFVQDKRNANIDVSAKEYNQFQVEFSETLFNMVDININQSVLNTQLVVIDEGGDDLPDWLVEAERNLGDKDLFAEQTEAAEKRAAFYTARAAKTAITRAKNEAIKVEAKKAKAAQEAAEAEAKEVIDTHVRLKKEEERAAASGLEAEASAASVSVASSPSPQDILNRPPPEPLN